MGNSIVSSDWEANYVESGGKRVETESFFESRIVKNLIRESEKYPLLSREEEQQYIAAYQIPRDALYALAQSTYGKEKYPDPKSWTSKAEIGVIKAILTAGGPHYNEGAKFARDRMVLHNLRLIKRFAKSKKGLDRFDTVIFGVNGLLHALDKFDRNKRTPQGLPFKFSTYATNWVVQYIQRAAQDKSRMIRIPIHIHDQINKIGKVYAQLASENFDSAPPSAEQLSKVTGFPVETVKLLGFFKLDHFMSSLDVDVSDDGDDTLADSLAAPESLQPEEVVEKEANKSYLEELLSTLGTEDANFMKLYSGIIDGRPRTVRELASVFGVPQKVIAARIDSLMDKLRQEGDPSKVCWED